MEYLDNLNVIFGKILFGLRELVDVCKVTQNGEINWVIS